MVYNYINYHYGLLCPGKQKGKDMKIVVDGFGGDNAPREVVGGCITAVN